MTSETEKRTLLEAIARKDLGVRTLETRNSESLDFHSLGVWSLRAALEAAYEAGRRADSPKGKPKRSMKRG